MADINLKHKHNSMNRGEENEKSIHALVKSLLKGDLDGDFEDDSDYEDLDTFEDSEEFKNLDPFVDPQYFEDEDWNDWESSESFIINPESKVVTYLSDFEDPVVVKTHPEDDFDKYIGAALSYVYAEFGSKTQFRKFVDEHSKVLKSREERKEDKKKHKAAKTVGKTKKVRYCLASEPKVEINFTTRDGEDDCRCAAKAVSCKKRGRPAKKVSE